MSETTIVALLPAFLNHVGKPFVAYDPLKRKFQVWIDEKETLKTVKLLMKAITDVEKSEGISLVSKHKELIEIFSNEKNVIEAYTTERGRIRLLSIFYDILGDIIITKELHPVYQMLQSKELAIPLVLYQQTIQSNYVNAGREWVLIPLNESDERPPIRLPGKNFLFFMKEGENKIKLIRLDNCYDDSYKQKNEASVFSITDSVSYNSHPFFNNHPDGEMGNTMFEKYGPLPILCEGFECILAPYTGKGKTREIPQEGLSIIYENLRECWFHRERDIISKDSEGCETSHEIEQEMTIGKRKIAFRAIICKKSFPGIIELQRAFVRMDALLETANSIEDAKKHKNYPASWRKVEKTLLIPIIKRMAIIIRRNNLLPEWIRRVDIYLKHDTIFWGLSSVKAAAKAVKEEGIVQIEINYSSLLIDIFQGNFKEFLVTAIHEMTHIADPTISLAKDPVYRFKSEGLAQLLPWSKKKIPEPVNLKALKEGLDEEDMYVLRDFKKGVMPHDMNRFQKIFYTKTMAVSMLLLMSYLINNNSDENINIAIIKENTGWKKFLAVSETANMREVPLKDINSIESDNITLSFNIPLARRKELVDLFITEMKSWSGELLVEEIKKAYRLFQIPNGESFEAFNVEDPTIS